MDKLLRTRFYIKKYFFTAHRGLEFLLLYFTVFVQYSSLTLICRSSDHTVGRPHGTRFEPGTGSLEAGTLTSRQPHLLNIKISNQFGERKLWFKGGMSRDFWHFFISWIKAIWDPDQQAKIVLLKRSFSRRYSRKILLCAVLACRLRSG